MRSISCLPGKLHMPNQKNSTKSWRYNCIIIGKTGKFDWTINDINIENIS